MAPTKSKQKGGGEREAGKVLPLLQMEGDSLLDAELDADKLAGESTVVQLREFIGLHAERPRAGVRKAELVQKALQLLLDMQKALELERAKQQPEDTATAATTTTTTATTTTTSRTKRAATPSKRVLPAPKRSKLLASAKKSSKKKTKKNAEPEEDDQQDIVMEEKEKTPRRTSSAFVGGSLLAELSGQSSKTTLTPAKQVKVEKKLDQQVSKMFVVPVATPSRTSRRVPKQPDVPRHSPSPKTPLSSDAREPGIGESSEDEVPKTPDASITENVFQSSSSARKRRTKSSIINREDQSAARRVQSAVLQRELPNKAKSSPRLVVKPPLAPLTEQSSPVFRPTKLFPPNAQRSQRKVVHKAAVPPAQLRNRFRLVLNILVAVVVAILAFYITSRSLSNPFCDTNVVPDSKNGCIACPTGATCADGVARCPRGLVLQDSECVDDPEVVTLSKELHSEVRALASRRLGEVQCGLRVEEENTLSLDEVEQYLRPRFGDESHFDDAWAKARFRITLGNEKSGELRYKTLRIWSMSPSKPFSCFMRHWLSEQKLTLSLVLAAVVIALYLLRQKRITKQRHVHAAIIFKKALLLLKDSSGPFALDHLYEHAFEQSNIRKDRVVWDLALDQLIRDARINNAVTSVNGRQRKGLMFTHTPMKGMRNKTVHVYPSATPRS